jgi:hypothetical protein
MLRSPEQLDIYLLLASSSARVESIKVLPMTPELACNHVGRLRATSYVEAGYQGIQLLALEISCEQRLKQILVAAGCYEVTEFPTQLNEAGWPHKKWQVTDQLCGEPVTTFYHFLILGQIIFQNFPKR